MAPAFLSHSPLCLPLSRNLRVPLRLLLQSLPPSPNLFRVDQWHHVGRPYCPPRSLLQQRCLRQLNVNLARVRHLKGAPQNQTPRSTTVQPPSGASATARAALAQLSTTRAVRTPTRSAATTHGGARLSFGYPQPTSVYRRRSGRVSTRMKNSTPASQLQDESDSSSKKYRMHPNPRARGPITIKEPRKCRSAHRGQEIRREDHARG